ncbi:hypothetical protein [Mycolicibacterium arseniciresistens]|uniref:Uncharacterized protein n=1 Tax=Mycolicibacterium arseniciresistens TaxID=3062257 RepID=A0ABT8UFF6_9MYCO|nr:hypothetical protein [Mycolicibacterium arseniciresistens]MDO3636516.1 hypothetical protein [Mycolicibacterium arseniciresistens]
MSRRTEAKKARRRKRRTVREERRLGGEVLSLEAVDEVLTDRGWEFDVENSTDDIATWFFPPSGVEMIGDTVESVTRIWLGADDEDTWHVIFVGAGAESVDYVFTADSLLENLEAIEQYRHGDPAPAFD